MICVHVYKEIGIQSELHRNNVYQSVELLLLVPTVCFFAGHF